MADEQIVFYPAPDAAARAWVPNADALYDSALADPAGFWGERTSDLTWCEPFDQVLDDSNALFFTWFPGGKTNIVANAIDRHLTGPTATSWR